MILDIAAKLLDEVKARGLKYSEAGGLAGALGAAASKARKAVEDETGKPAILVGKSGIVSAFRIADAGGASYYASDGDLLVGFASVVPAIKAKAITAPVDGVTTPSLATVEAFDRYAAEVVAKGVDFFNGMHDDLDEELANAPTVEVVAKSAERRLVYGVVLAPERVDLQGDIISAEEIEASAHDYMLKSRMIGEQHAGLVDAAPVESFIAPCDFDAGDGESKATIKKGSWVLVVKVLDGETWAKVKKGELTAFSPAGFAVRSPA